MTGGYGIRARQRPDGSPRGISWDITQWEITDHAIDFIKRKAKAKQPFFAYVPYTQTHEPVDAHSDYKGKTGNGSFADVLAQTDAYVGELLDTIDKLGLKDNTIFIFTSDNGREKPVGSPEHQDRCHRWTDDPPCPLDRDDSRHQNS